MAIAATFPAARAARPTRPAVRRPAAPTAAVRTAAVPSPSVRRPTRSTGLVLTRRGRLVLGVVSGLFLLVVVMVSGRFTADAGTAMADQVRATGVVVVQPGESLWQIARTIAPDTDPREMVTRIRELNQLGAAAVVPGQSLVVPVAAS